MKRFAVFGNPIKQSISPIIHQHFADQAGLSIQYDRKLSTTEQFIEDISHFFSNSECVGCNITAPFKEQAFQLVSHRDDSARLAKAVNTIYRNDKNELCGANTDGVGLVNDIKRTVTELSGKRVLLLGAGGAARGALFPLLAESVASIAIANRTYAKAEQLAVEVNNERVTAVDIHKCEQKFDVVINSTSAGLTGGIPELGRLSFSEVSLTYDMVYQKVLTPFLAHAQKNGSENVCDGLGMLVGQAAAAFTIWTGYRPDTSDLLVMLRTQMS
ncbi:shikimate dehydrogenase [Alteromonas sediminis]|uniref:Shikimate dehydrogenase (NADP(+)) n=1 Tax=Alteromonas sediminis TaxID=2259342 RepID=A0A3N5XZN7_9ALTE|nr:shikimate dehydrogenase [Alteromonas sediminis]RPJ66807.1 shikimate dehydrogenase [Alteromonas sediminis]